MNSRAVYRSGNSIRKGTAKAAYYRRSSTVHCVLPVLAGVVCLVLILLLHVVHTQASSDQHINKFKYYTNVMISSEMSLQDYAEEYADPQYYKSDDAYISEVVDINHLQTLDGEVSGVTPGTYLVIPYYCTEFYD